MPKTGGEITKKKILQVAEDLFSEDGFDGTGIEKIAKAAGINKASIYYHFKDKNDIIKSLFQNILTELDEYLDHASFDGTSRGKAVSLEDKIKEEIDHMSSKRKILSVLFMESLKSTNTVSLLFQCAESIINKELEGTKQFHKKMGKKQTEDHRYLMVYEFFTGFIPILAFILLRDKWCSYYACDREALIDDFIESFSRSHLGRREDG